VLFFIENKIKLNDIVKYDGFGKLIKGVGYSNDCRVGRVDGNILTSNCNGFLIKTDITTVLDCTNNNGTLKCL
jgi:hypothetical protein